MLLKYKTRSINIPVPAHTIAYGSIAVAILLLLAVLIRSSCAKREELPEDLPEVDNTNVVIVKMDPLTLPVRPMPERFRRDTSLPGPREINCSDPIDMETFSAGRDLVYVDDPRVYWESDNDSKEMDVECDHTFNRAAEEPFRRLLNLLLKHHPGSTLEVQEAFRPTGIHVQRSLHREGRALDLTCDQIPLEELAKLCWAAGFDWVLYEHKKGTGPHIHASVKRIPFSE